MKPGTRRVFFFLLVRNPCGGLLRYNYHQGKNELKIQPTLDVMKHNINLNTTKSQQVLFLNLFIE